MKLKPTKFLILTVLLTLTFSQTGMENSFSAVKAGDKCPKIGLSKINGNKKFVCVKVGNKTIWSDSSKFSPSQKLDSHGQVVLLISKEWKNWRSKAAKEFKPIQIIAEPGYEPKWSTAPLKPANILAATLIGNGHLLYQDPISIYGDTEEWISKVAQPFSCGGGKIPDQALGIYCGRIQAGLGPFILNQPETDKFNTGKILTKKQELTLTYSVVHDLATMYELQAQYGLEKYSGSKNQIPAWIREGFVQLFASLALTDSIGTKQNYSEFTQSEALFEPFAKKLCSKTLQDFESKNRNWGNSCIASQNLYAVELLAARHGGLGALFNFVSLFGTSDNWPTSFKTAFGISREDFYAEWYDYLEIPKSERPELQPPAPSVHY